MGAQESIERSRHENYEAEASAQEEFCGGLQWTSEQMAAILDRLKARPNFQIEEENGNDPRGED